MKTLHYIGISLSVVLMLACNRKQEDFISPTVGKMSILAEESCKYITEQQEEIFERTYKYADLSISYAPAADVFNEFLTDSTKVIITTRKLTEDEKSFLLQRQIIPREYLFATSAIAFVKNNESADTTYVYETLLRDMQDEKSGVVFVLENAKSGIAGHMLDLLGKENLPPHFFAYETKEEVLAYVEEHDNAIGLIDYGDISDSDSAFTREVLKRIQLLAISQPVDSAQVGFVKPFQYNLQDRKYPFTQELYFITRTGKTDVSIGFAAFICGEIGQKIVLKSGLLPTYQSERILEFNYTNDIKVVK